MSCGTEIPIVCGFRPRAIGRNCVNACRLCVVDGKAEKLVSNTGGVVAKDGERCKSQTAIANTIPVTGDGALTPPSVRGTGSEDSKT